ncbi:MAG: 2-phosphosulfolactate phosphatase [Eubacteriales bacterium]
MKMTTLPTYTHIEPTEFAGKTAIVIDLLRATSTICTALHNGCRKVIPVEEVEEAIRLTREIGLHTPVVSGGERDGAKLPGFDYGNSPLEYSSTTISGKVLVLCTTNGTQAFHVAAGAQAVYAGCLNNARAVAKKAVDDGRDIMILCAGTRCRFSADDVTAAGAIIHRIREIINIDDADMDDLSHTALWLYEKNRSDLYGLLQISRPYRTLAQLNRMEDIDYCFQEDIVDLVPQFLNGDIV